MFKLTIPPYQLWELIDEILEIPFVVLFAVALLFWNCPAVKPLVDVPIVPGIETACPEFQDWIKSTFIVPSAFLKLSAKNLLPLIAPVPLEPPPRPHDPYTTVDNFILSEIL